LSLPLFAVVEAVVALVGSSDTPKAAKNREALHVGPCTALIVAYSAGTALRRVPIAVPGPVLAICGRILHPLACVRTPSMVR